MTELDLLIDLHMMNDRQAPGSDDATRRALTLTGIDPTEPIAAADLGCGTGASALVLARELNARITAIDLAPPFVERLKERAASAGLSDRIDARVGDMGDPQIDDGSLDLLWSEGAIYTIGFDEGIRAWKRLLKPSGVLVLSELVWTTHERPDGVTAHWEREYPGIRTVGENRHSLEDAGYSVLGDFTLPETSWRDAYHGPLSAVIDAFLERHKGSQAAANVAQEARAEIEHFERHGRWYTYAFFVARPEDQG